MYTSLFINDLRDFSNTKLFEKEKLYEKHKNGEKYYGSKLTRIKNSVVDDDSNALAPALAEESNRTVQENRIENMV